MAILQMANPVQTMKTMMNILNLTPGVPSMKYKFIFLCVYLLGSSMSLHALKSQNKEGPPLPVSAQRIVAVNHLTT